MTGASLREQVAAERAALRAAYLKKPDPRALLEGACAAHRPHQ